MKGETVLKKVPPINPIVSEINSTDLIKKHFLKTILILYSNPRPSFKVYLEFVIYKDKSLYLTPCFLEHNGDSCNSTCGAASGCGVVCHTAPAVLRTTLLILITSISWSTFGLRLLHTSQALPFGPCPTSHFSRGGVHKSGVPGRHGDYILYSAS
jgi:hypothetical protein